MAVKLTVRQRDKPVVLTVEQVKIIHDSVYPTYDGEYEIDIDLELEMLDPVAADG